MPYHIPRSVLECFDPETQEFSDDLSILYKRRKQIEASTEDDDKYELDAIIDEGDEVTETNTTRDKRKRRPKEKRLYRCPHDNTMKKYCAEHTPWYREYVADPPLNEPKFHKKFRRRFRMSYESYIKHLVEVKESPLFKQ